MEKLFDKLNAFFFGKYLKLILLLVGIACCFYTINPYRNPASEVIGETIRYGILTVGFIFSAVYIHMKERRDNSEN